MNRTEGLIGLASMRMRTCPRPHGGDGTSRTCSTFSGSPQASQTTAFMVVSPTSGLDVQPHRHREVVAGPAGAHRSAVVGTAETVRPPLGVRHLLDDLGRIDLAPPPLMVQHSRRDAD